ncbi:hypothetical protein [Aurantimonas sp. HBX-1]|uniref:hypothetical protein n=1 Tax=Aurantimonas sp. HBX-1 TaxID=2906072 RepID=UPI001F399734|nr:hypothetical protein [Aurantimonas sp. HBX-1]UIJ70426.1 hypothetical protein LXB15_11650 [Aurantimonas sp. HBX-1]
MPMLVLPLAFGRLSALQINVFLAVALTDARARLANGSQRGLSADGKNALATIMAAIASDLWITVADPHRLHGEASAYLESHGGMMR